MHRNIELPKVHHKEFSLLQSQDIKCKVGARFLFDHDISYEVDKIMRSIAFKDITFPLPEVGNNEVSRCTTLVTSLSVQYPECTIKVWTNMEHYCPFTGGEILSCIGSRVQPRVV